MTDPTLPPDVLALLRKFAAAADDLDEDHPDNCNIWESPAALGIDAGDLREARRLIETYSPGEIG